MIQNDPNAEQEKAAKIFQLSSLQADASHLKWRIQYFLDRFQTSNNRLLKAMNELKDALDEEGRKAHGSL